MVERDINNKLVEDVTRILTIEESLKGAEHIDWSKMLKNVEKKLNSGEEQDLIDQINEILDSHSAETSIGGILDKTYLTNTRTLLRYRMENTVKNPKITYKNPHQMEPEDYSKLKDTLQKCGSTVIGYSELEEAGSIEDLEAELSEILNEPVTVRVFKRQDTEIFREKDPYLGHKIWTCTQILPLVVIYLR